MYRLLSQEQASLDNKGDLAWRSLYLFNYYVESSFARTHFPKTMQLLYDTIPGVSSAFFSVVDGGLHLDGHLGVFEGVMRFVFLYSCCYMPFKIWAYSCSATIVWQNSRDKAPLV